MPLTRPFVLALILITAAPTAHGASTTKRVGQVTFVVEDDGAVPGGLFVARLVSPRSLGAAFAILDGRKANAFQAARGPRALVPIPADAGSGEVTVGFEILSRRGRQRIPVSARIGARSFGERRVDIPPAWRRSLSSADAARDERVLIGLLRTQSPSPPETLRPPVDGVEGAGFGERIVTTDGTRIAQRIDGTWGEVHRGLDFAVSAGTAVRAPGRGVVLFAGDLTLAGRTVVIDHGQGVISVLMHMARLDVAAGDTITAGTSLGISGETGLVTKPLVEWRTYIHGIAVDPSLLKRSLD